MNSDKRGQIGETTTWVVATIIIVVILAVSILITSAFGTVGFLKKAYDLDYKMDFIPIKSLSAYLLSSDLENSGKIIFQKLTEDEEFNELNGVNGELASQIFNRFYGKEYPVIWFGLSLDGQVRSSAFFKTDVEAAEWNLNVRPCGGDSFFLKNKSKEVRLDLCR